MIRAIISRFFLVGLFSFLSLQAGDFYSLEREFKLPMSRPEASLNQVVSPDGKYIAFYEQPQREELQANPQHGHFAPSLDIKIWDVQESKLKATLEGHKYQVAVCAFSPDSTKLFSADVVGEMHHWDIDREICIDDSDARLPSLSALTFNTSGTAIIVGFDDRQVRFDDQQERHNIHIEYFQSALGVSRRTISQAHIQKIISLCTRCIDYKEYIFSASRDYSVVQWNAHGQRKHIGPVYEFQENRSVINALEVTADGAFVLVSRSAFYPGNPKGLLQLYAESTGAELFTFIDDALTVVHENGLVASRAAHDGLIKALAFSRDNRRIISGSHDKTIKVWNRESGKLIEVLEECSAPVIALAMTKDDHLVACCSDGTVKIFKDFAEQKEAELKRKERERIEREAKEDREEKKYKKAQYESFIRRGPCFSKMSGFLASLNEMRLGFKNKARQDRELYMYTSGQSGDQRLDVVMNRKIGMPVLATAELTNFNLCKVFELSERELLLSSLNDAVIYDRLTGRVVRQLMSPGESYQDCGDNHLVKENQLFTCFG